MKRYNFTLLEKQNHLLKIILFAFGILLGPSLFSVFATSLVIALLISTLLLFTFQHTNELYAY